MNMEWEYAHVTSHFDIKWENAWLSILLQLEVQYLHDYAGISASVGLTATPIINFSGVFGTNLAAIGTDVAYDTNTGAFTKYNAGISYTNADVIAALTLWVVHFYQFKSSCFLFII